MHTFNGLVFIILAYFMVACQASELMVDPFQEPTLECHFPSDNVKMATWDFVRGSQPPQDVATWTKGTGEVDKSWATHAEVPAHSHSSFPLLLKNVSYAVHDGTYRCRTVVSLSNNNATLVNETRVSVTHSPQIFIGATTVHFHPNVSVQVTMTVNGNPLPTVSCHRNSTTGTTGEELFRFVLELNDTASTDFSSQYTLTLASPAAADEGQYYCVASSHAGSATLPFFLVAGKSDVNLIADIKTSNLENQRANSGGIVESTEFWAPFLSVLLCVTLGMGM